MSSSTATPEQLASTEAEFQQGISLISTDPEQAVQLIGKVLEFRNSVHGELAEECAETYLWYARALLEQARASTDPLTEAAAPAAAGAGPSPPGNASEAQPSEAPRTAAGPEQAPKATTGATSAEPTADSAAPKPAREEASHDKQASQESWGSGKEADGDDEGGEGKGSDQEVGSEEGGEEDEQEGEEEANDSDDLKLAWDMLELARVICSKSSNPKLVAIQASVHLSLGDVSAERDQFEVALAEYAKCQALLEGTEKKDKRALAGVHFSTMLALTMVDDLPQARTHCKQAIALLESCRTEVLQAMDTPVEGETGAEADEAIDRLDRELEEVESLLKDLKDRMEDMEGAIKEQAEFKTALKGAMQSLVAQQSKTQPLVGGSALQTASAPTPASGSGAAAAPDNATPAAAPTAAGSGSGVVQDLGVAGRGRKRITLQPCQPNANTTTTTAPAAAATVTASPKTTVPAKRGAEEVAGNAAGEENGGLTKKQAVVVACQEAGAAENAA